MRSRRKEEDGGQHEIEKHAEVGEDFGEREVHIGVRSDEDDQVDPKGDSLQRCIAGRQQQHDARQYYPRRMDERFPIDDGRLADEQKLDAVECHQRAKESGKQK